MVLSVGITGVLHVLIVVIGRGFIWVRTVILSVREESFFDPSHSFRMTLRIVYGFRHTLKLKININLLMLHTALVFPLVHINAVNEGEKQIAI